MRWLQSSGEPRRPQAIRPRRSARLRISKSEIGSSSAIIENRRGKIETLSNQISRADWMAWWRSRKGETVASSLENLLLPQHRSTSSSVHEKLAIFPAGRPSSALPFFEALSKQTSNPASLSASGIPYAGLVVRGLSGSFCRRCELLHLTVFFYLFFYIFPILK